MENLLDIAILDESDMDDILLYELLSSREHPNRRSLQYGSFDIDDLTHNECKLYFRFEKDDIFVLRRAFGIPEKIMTEGRYTVSGEEGLCIALRRLAYPNRLSDIENIFGLSAPYLSVISNLVLKYISNRKKHLLLQLNNNPWLNQQKLQYYSEAIFEKGAPIRNCWGFIDGTARPICRPSINQQNYYSGHKRIHCLKYQSVICPDGIIVSLHGPYPGRRHDGGIFAETNLYDQLQACASFGDNKYVLYGDAAYPIMELLLKPFPTRTLNDDQDLFNQRMSSVRQAVEWGFGKIIAEFAFLDYKKNQKLYLQDLEAMYVSATILTNCHSCLYGSQTAKYFNINNVPSLEEYLQ